MKLSLPKLRGGIFSRMIRMMLWLLLAVIVTLAVSELGVRMLGSVENASTWFQTHTTAMFVWRLSLYSITAAGWIWMRRRVMQREPESARRLKRMEIIAVVSIILLEVCNWPFKGVS